MYEQDISTTVAADVQARRCRCDNPNHNHSDCTMTSVAAALADGPHCACGNKATYAVHIGGMVEECCTTCYIGLYRDNENETAAWEADEIPPVSLPNNAAAEPAQSEDTRACAACGGAGRTPNGSCTGDTAGGWADTCEDCGGSGVDSTPSLFAEIVAGLQAELDANFVQPLAELEAQAETIRQLRADLAQAHERTQSLVYFFHGALRAALAGIHPGTTEEGRAVIRGIIEHALTEGKEDRL